MRAARTKQENNGKERAEHALCTYIQDKMPTFDIFPATSQGLGEGEPHTEKTEPEDDQDEEKEQSLADCLPIRKQMATKVHEIMGHQTVRWFVCYALVEPIVDSYCGACEAQKRPAGSIVSRSANSFVFNDVVRFDQFFLNTNAKHTLPAMNIVCWDTGLQRVVPLRDACRDTWLRSYGRPASLSSVSNAACALALSQKKLKVTERDLKYHLWRRRGEMVRKLERLLLQDDTRRSRSTDMGRF